jgi:general nucleoside transport system ATP-binding protein
VNDATPRLRLAGITKRFGDVVANDGISLEVRSGEVLALLGENGAGKSTLVSILFGHYVADAGTVEVDGRPLPPGQPRAALAAGVGMVHQHFTLADNLSVLDNVMLGTEPLARLASRQREARARLASTARRFGLAVDADARVGDLSVGERQRVEILKALSRGARVLILDEPTAVLTPQESQSLFATLRQLVAEGMAIVFISHKLDEVMAVSDRIAVLRSGALVALQLAREADKAQLAALMVGRSVPPVAREHPLDVDLSSPARPTVLALRGATLRAAGRGAGLQDVNLELHAGEVLGIAGVAGNGQRALADLLCGLLPLDAGQLEVLGRPLPPRPADWVRAGVARIPEDRHAVGSIGELTLWENIVLERLAHRRFSRFGLLRAERARQHAQRVVEQYDVRGAGRLGLDAPARVLSGGNLQKLILGRALAGVRYRDEGPRVIVAHQPTWGLDVGAVADLQRRLLEACVRGAGVLLISEDLDEVLTLADRIAVMSRGRLGAARLRDAWSLADLGAAMAGLPPGSEPSAVAHAA